MYRSELKSSYLKGKNDIYQIQAITFFNKIEHIEIEENKDISKFYFEELLQSIEKIKPKNDKQAKMYCSFINGYVKFVNQNEENIIKDVESEFYLQFN